MTFATNKKAHFDSVPPQLRVVDGAKSRWCNLLFVDALIYLSELREINESSRRSFNQQQVLLECIVREAQLARPPSAGSDPFSAENISIEGDVYPWNSSCALRRLFLSDPTTKSKEKYIGIIDSLLEHPALRQRQGEVFTLFRDVVHKVLFKYPPLKGPSCLIRTPSTKEHPLRDPQASFDVGIFDDLAASELDTQPWDFLDAALDSNCVGERPTHPAPRSGLNYTGSVCDDEQKRVRTGFRSIADEDGSVTASTADPPLAVLRPVPKYAAAAMRSTASTSPFKFAASAPASILVPFPLGFTVLYERRVAFQAPPEVQFTGAAAELLQTARAADETDRIHYRVVSMQSSPVFMEQSVQSASVSTYCQHQKDCAGACGDCALDFDIDLECCSAWGDDDAGGEEEGGGMAARQATPAFVVEHATVTGEQGNDYDPKKRIFSEVEREEGCTEDEPLCKRRVGAF